MIQKKKKQLKIVILILVIVAIIGVGTWGIYKAVVNNNNGKSNEQEDLSRFGLKSLIVTTTLSEKELKDNYKAIEVNSLTFGATEIETYEIKYSTEKETKDAYEKLKENENVKNIDINEERIVNKIVDSVFYYNLQGGSEPISNWGPIAMGLDETVEVVNGKNDNQEIIVAVIDSGFDSDHSYIVGNETLKNRVKEGFNTLDDNTDITDDDGHGTNVGSIILEGSPDNVKILPIKALDVNEEGETVGTDASIIKAINYAVKNGADVINMSLGGESVRATEQEAINNAYNKNIICVAASGNGDDTGTAIDLDAQGVNFYPAECGNVITVGAVRNKLLIQDSNTTVEDLISNYSQYKNATINDIEITTFSNYGNVIDFVAPGQTIMGLFPETEKVNINWMSGTSQATPHISAAVALLKTYNKDYTNEKIEEILTYYSHDLGDKGKDVYYGNGFVSFKGFEECECGSEKCEKIYCAGCENTECIFHKGSTNRLLNIEITTEPTDTIYTFKSTQDENEYEFKKDGMEVIANYSDGSKKVIEDYICSPEKITLDMFEVEDLEETLGKVTIEYTENGITKTAVQNIQMNVNEEEPPQTTPETTSELTSIKITTPPAKTIYDEGETFDRAGMVITATYDDGTEKLVDRYVVEPTRALTKDDTKVTISYSENEIEKTVEQSITVKQKVNEPPEPQEKSLSSIKATSNPTKTTYTEGEKFNPSGMVIVANYSDGTSKIITDYTYEPSGALETTDKKVTISYKEKTTETIEIPITVLAANTGNTTNTTPNLNDNMFQFEGRTEEPQSNGTYTNEGNTNRQEETSSASSQQNNNNSNNNTKDETTTKEGIANAGLDDSAISIGIGIILIIMIASYIACKKYKEI